MEQYKLGMLMIQQLGGGKLPYYGYHVNPLKSVLLVKPAFYHQATELFADTGVRICTNGIQYLGAAIGTSEFIQSFLEHKVLRLREEVEKSLQLRRVSASSHIHCLHSRLEEQVVIFMPCHARRRYCLGPG